MEILRIEKGGRGPYWTDERKSDRLYDMCRKHNADVVKRPGPRDENEPFYIGGYVPPEYFFGFMDIEDLTRWFDHEDREILKEEGFTVAVYEVPSRDIRFGHQHGSGQVGFRKGEAKPIRQIPLEEIGVKETG